MRLFRTIGASVSLAFLSVLTSLPAWAEEAEAGEKGGLPQFDVTMFPEQIFWLVVNFVALYCLLAWVALPRIARAQGNRQTVIAAEIEVARAANEDAKAMVAAVEKSLAQARAEGQAKVSEMLAQVTKEANEHQAAQEKDLSRQLHRAEEAIAVTRAAAMNQVRASAADLASTIIARILNFQKQAGA